MRWKSKKGRDEKERNHWVRALESVIRECGGYRKAPKNKENASEALKHKIVEADQHLSDIILQVRGLESLKEHASEKERKNVEELITSSNKLLDTVKHAIILLQMARNKIEIPDDVRKEDKENVNHGSEGAGDVPDKHSRTSVSRRHPNLRFTNRPVRLVTRLLTSITIDTRRRQSQQ
ncbi:hypothetical protein Y032_0077g1083 [Ancylostoma ceylanicum]|uniref:PH domain-containing protein n=1 Tax=Ancylostoma ceylanicum TaxID=53326 RepID=A0A016TU85_9BILA|nr:hypothetical protein Y032_0077g1083 [Ancylostoma ceylanicum]